MPSLADVAPPELTAETVDIRGTPLRVQAIDGEGWMRLHTRFPELAPILDGRAGDLTRLETLRVQAGLIAAGLGAPDDAATERLVVDKLTPADQQRIMEVIFRLSLPGHVYRPLLDGAADDRGRATEAPVTKS